MNKYAIALVDSIFKHAEKEFDLEVFENPKDLVDALEYFESRAKMFIEDTKKSLD